MACARGASTALGIEAAAQGIEFVARDNEFVARGIDALANYIEALARDIETGRESGLLATGAGSWYAGRDHPVATPLPPTLDPEQTSHALSDDRGTAAALAIGVAHALAEATQRRVAQREQPPWSHRSPHDQEPQSRSSARDQEPGRAPSQPAPPDPLQLQLLLTCAASAGLLLVSGDEDLLPLVQRWLPWVACGRCDDGAALVTKLAPEPGAAPARDVVLWLDGSDPARARRLAEQVALATRHAPRGYLFLPGLLVPEGAGFSYDQHGPDIIDLDLIKHRLALGAPGAPRTYRLILPAYVDHRGAEAALATDHRGAEAALATDAAAGLLRGYGLIEWGHPVLPPLVAAHLGSHPFLVEEVPAAQAGRLLGHAGPLALSRAEERLLHGDLEQAEAICALRLQAQPRDVGALALMGRLAARLRRPKAAAHYFRRAIAAAGPAQDAVAQLALDFASYHAGPESPALEVEAPPPRYLVIDDRSTEAALALDPRGPGSLAQELQHVLGALLLAELTGRSPRLCAPSGDGLPPRRPAQGDPHLQHPSPLAPQPRRPALRDLFQLTSAPRSGAAADPLSAPGLRWFPPGAAPGTALPEDLPALCGLHYLDRPEDVLVLKRSILVSELCPWLDVPADQGEAVREVQRRLLRQHLRLDPLVVALLEEAVDALLGESPYVAVHAPGAPPLSGSGAQARLAEAAEHLERELAVLPRATPVLLVACGAGAALLGDVCHRAGRRALVEEPPAQETALSELRLLWLMAQAELLIGDGDSPLTASAAVLQERPPRRLIEIGKSPFLARRLRPPEVDTRQRDHAYRRF